MHDPADPDLVSKQELRRKLESLGRFQLWPALLAAITDLSGTITGILRTWLDPQRPAKAPLADPRRALGHLLGNGVRFGQAADILAAGEGVEIMLALKSVLPFLPMVAGLSANHLAALELPAALRRLYVARDNDAVSRHGCSRLSNQRRRIGDRRPRPDEILVVLAIADGGRLRNRCGTEPIR
jgi:hypothetical protein